MACPSMAGPLASDICCLVKLDISAAISVSLSLDSEAIRFSEAYLKLLRFDSKVFFWNAPRFPLADVTS